MVFLLSDPSSNPSADIGFLEVTDICHSNIQRGVFVLEEQGIHRIELEVKARMSAKPSIAESFEGPNRATDDRVELRLTQRPIRNRVERLVDLAATLLEEAETLARDRVFTEESSRSLNFSQGINFYDEVERFETNLIKLALDQTGGNQAQAARLLRIKPTTLNSKIKLYGIELTRSPSI